MLITEIVEPKLSAPNGKPSNLTPKLWKLVRTPEFKEWFGDWENDKKNASKIVDENGEPKLVYHGTSKYGFDEFKTNPALNDLIFFSEERKGAEIFGSGVYTVFLNIRKPYARGRIFKSTEEIETKDKAAKSSDGFAVADWSWPSGFAEKNWAVWNPKQIMIVKE